MPTSLDFNYPAVRNLLDNYLVPGRSESRAFLMWYLENYYRLDEADVQDAVCDGPDDKGIDAIYIDENLEQIDVLQCKLLQNNSRTIGDGSLREFVGTLAQFTDPKFVRSIISSTSNVELAGLLEDSDVAGLIEKGYSVKGIFVTNSTLDNNAIQYMSGQSPLEVFDRNKLQDLYVPFDLIEPIQGTVVFDTFENGVIEYQTEKSKAIIAALPASILVTMEGIANQTLFDWNVRKSLGRTKVNRDIEKSVGNITEHPDFFLFHNGLTILCESLKTNGDRIEISGYSVVNGCQSLTTLYNNRRNVSDQIKILTRIIEVSPETALAVKITSRTNNQNGITARDLKSNSALQSRLQLEINKLYPEIFYRIKRGENTERPVIIDNELAAKLLLAFDLREPWACHQTYKLFDDSHAAVFGRKEVTSTRIVALYDIFSSVLASVSQIENKPFSDYNLTKFFLMYLVREALNGDPTGKSFCQKPEDFITNSQERQQLRYCIQNMLSALLVDLNGELKLREEKEQPFDYKREFKSPNAVRQLVRSIIPQYQILVNRKRITSFGEDWKESATLVVSDLPKLS